MSNIQNILDFLVHLMLPPECVFADASRQHMRRATFSPNVSHEVFPKALVYVHVLLLINMQVPPLFEQAASNACLAKVTCKKNSHIAHEQPALILTVRGSNCKQHSHHLELFRNATHQTLLHRSEPTGNT